MRQLLCQKSALPTLQHECRLQQGAIGPAFMQGLMGKGQPWGRYDDMWAGWASKTADHLGVGCKGHPYIKHTRLQILCQSDEGV